MKQKVSGKVLFIALVAALGGILFGYDTAVISGTTEVVKMQFGLSTGLEGWYVGCALIGSIIGVLLAGIIMGLASAGIFGAAGALIGK